MLYSKKISTACGKMTAVCDDSSIIRLMFPDGNTERDRLLLWEAAPNGENELCRLCAAQLGEYFEGKRRKFSIPLAFRGTTFEKCVWEALRTVPYGHTVSYSGLARLAGEGGGRAVGNAVGKNPIAILVPCHRVVHQDGTIGGFGGGLPNKILLLNLEGAAWRPNRGGGEGPKKKSRVRPIF